MTSQNLRLSDLKLITYKASNIPLEFSEEMQSNVVLALIANVIAILFMWFVPDVLDALSQSWFTNPFDFPFPGAIFSYSSDALEIISLPLMVASGIGLLFIVAVLVLSRFMQEPCREYVHRMAFASIVPATIGGLTSTLSTITTAIAIAVALIIWILIVAAIIAAIILCLAIIGIIGFLVTNSG